MTSSAHGFVFFSSRRRHTRCGRDWSSDVCSSDLAVLEKLIAYEAVHEIQGWDDLRRRLAADRRCFAFFHPALPGEPLIFVEVALVRGLSGSVRALLER